MRSIFRLFIFASALASVPFAASLAQAQDLVGSYGGVSYGAGRADDDEVPIAGDAVLAISESFQVRATVGPSIVQIAPTYSISAGNWRFAAGPGFSLYNETETRDFIDDEGNQDSFEEETSETSLMGLIAAERLIGEYAVGYATVSFADEVSASVGIGLKF